MNSHPARNRPTPAPRAAAEGGAAGGFDLLAGHCPCCACPSPRDGRRLRRLGDRRACYGRARRRACHTAMNSWGSSVSWSTVSWYCSAGIRSNRLAAMSPVIADGAMSKLTRTSRKVSTN